MLSRPSPVPTPLTHGAKSTVISKVTSSTVHGPAFRGKSSGSLFGSRRENSGDGTVSPNALELVREWEASATPRRPDVPGRSDGRRVGVGRHLPVGNRFRP